MEKDIGKIAKNTDTDIMIRIDDFGGKTGLTIREYVKGERYTGFTKAGTRIPADKFKQFKQIINSIDEKDLVNDENQEQPSGKKEASKKAKKDVSEDEKRMEDEMDEELENEDADEEVAM